MNPVHRAQVDALTKRLTDEGRIIEAGWAAYRGLVMSPTSPPLQVTETRKAFYAGAQHLFGSIMTVMGDGDTEPTPEDLHRVTQINDELEGFKGELLAEIRGRRP